MNGENDRFVLRVGQLPQQVHQNVSGETIQPRSGLVQNYQCGVGNELVRDGSALLLAPADALNHVAANHGVRAVLQLQLVY